jgi:hypothetical protein
MGISKYIPTRAKRRTSLIPFPNAGDGSTLSFDFTAMGNTLDSRFTFTRSSTTSTYINSSGLVANAGTNVPRFDYDPTTLAARGLLIEGASTNQLQYSSAFNNAVWGGGGYTFGTGETSPDGTNASQRLTVSSASATCNRQQSATINATSCTFSIWWKNGNHTAGTNTALRTIAVRNGTTAVVNVVVATGFFVAFCCNFATCDADASGHTIARVAIGVNVATIATIGPTYFILTPCNTKFFPSEEAVPNVGYGS